MKLLTLLHKETGTKFVEVEHGLWQTHDKDGNNIYCSGDLPLHMLISHLKYQISNEKDGSQNES